MKIRRSFYSHILSIALCLLSLGLALPTYGDGDLTFLISTAPSFETFKIAAVSERSKNFTSTAANHLDSSDADSPDPACAELVNASLKNEKMNDKDSKLFNTISQAAQFLTTAEIYRVTFEYVGTRESFSEDLIDLLVDSELRNENFTKIFNKKFETNHSTKEVIDILFSNYGGYLVTELDKIGYCIS